MPEIGLPELLEATGSVHAPSGNLNRTNECPRATPALDAYATLTLTAGEVRRRYQYTDADHRGLVREFDAEISRRTRSRTGFAVDGLTGQALTECHTEWCAELRRHLGPAAGLTVELRETRQLVEIDGVDDLRHTLRVVMDADTPVAGAIRRVWGTATRSDMNLATLAVVIGRMLRSVVHTAGLPSIEQPALDDVETLVFHGASGAALVHELVGHVCEGDNYLRYGEAAGLSPDARIGPSALHVLDDPSIATFGGWSIDDEGTRRQEVELVVSGRISSLVHDRSSAAQLACASNGHGRSATAGGAVLPRAAAIAMMPGPDDPYLELASRRPTILVWDSPSGFVDWKRLEATVAIPGAALVRGAEVIGRLPPLTLRTELRGGLHALQGIGGGVGWQSLICVKQGQWLRASAGAPPFAWARQKAKLTVAGTESAR